MYFSEQGNVDNDATLITIFLVSFNLQSYCPMQSAVCSLQSANVIHREKGKLYGDRLRLNRQRRCLYN